jgi:hypothetical protein
MLRRSIEPKAVSCRSGGLGGEQLTGSPAQQVEGKDGALMAAKSASIPLHSKRVAQMAGGDEHVDGGTRT